MELAKGLWRAGHSLSQIAALVTTAFGVERSKNAVAGKLDKLGEIGTRRTAKRVAAVRTAHRAGCVSHKVVLEPLPAFFGKPIGLPADEPIPATAVTLEDRADDQCVWPVNHGDPDFLFCGARKAPGETRFCEHHASKAYAVAPDA